MSTLVIVESPSKAKKIQSYLGSGYVVRASLGHVRDLPSTKAEIPAKYAGEAWARLGVHVEEGFKPLYIVPASKAKVVKELRELAKGADRVLLATDPDREGEAIAWHLARALGLGTDPERMTFHEITKDAIQAAARRTRPIDYALVGAQESRRIIDRLLGYGVSPLLWNSISSGLSAGRVQSAALAALAHREQARMAHVAAPYWRVTATVGEPAFTATVFSVSGKRLATPKDFDPATGQLRTPALVLTPEQAAQLVAFLKARPVTVAAVERTPYSTRPPAPFTTSTLQQEASKGLKFSPKQSMDVAQRLYEGGHITYMRTDSPSLSEEATQAARAVAVAAFGASAVPAAPREYAAKAKNAQEAHEAIRPAGRSFKAPQDTGLSGGELALYDLIYRRTVASQMLDVQGTKTGLTLKAGGVQLGATGRTVTEPGFTRLYQDVPEGEGEDAQALPDVQEGTTLPVQDARAEEKHTPAPGRFTEASLVRALEKVGVGRPSTYASILSTLDARGYTRVVKRQLTVTWLGLLVSAYLSKFFADLVDVQFTAQMEADLDQIAVGALRREAYLTRFWTEGFARVIARAPQQAPSVPVPRVPGAVVTVKAGEVVLSLDGRSAPLPPELSPDELTAEVAGEVLSGTALGPVRRAATREGKVRRTGGSLKKRAGAPRKKKAA
ncbi:type I DNA topoisomerase [Deinococcus aestuarii]|uniref:type I DNA topoisomerase n=1 Tax=Deinococcus aestuarii TaxID=2774531 RepID=UPI001C0D16AC